MMLRLLAAGLALALHAAVVPHAAAYLTPEQVLDQSAYSNFAPDPGEQQHPAAYNDEEEASGIRPIRNQKPIYREQKSKGPHITLKKFQPAAAEEDATIIDEEAVEAEDESSVTIKLNTRVLRLLERITRPAAPNMLIPSAHQGAPLTPTGPATVIAMMAMGLAIFGTIRRAAAMEKRMKN